MYSRQSSPSADATVQPGFSIGGRSSTGQPPDLDDPVGTADPVDHAGDPRSLDRPVELGSGDAVTDGGEDRSRLGPRFELAVDPIAQDLADLAAERKADQRQHHDRRRERRQAGAGRESELHHGIRRTNPTPRTVSMIFGRPAAASLRRR